MTAQKIDVTVYGASGFTGKLVAEYLADRHRRDPDFSWAMAGRNQGKLEAVQAELGTDVPTIVADADRPETVAALAERSKVVIAVVGPYQLYGSALVEACARTGTDYVDLCGEPAWMRQMIDAHGPVAAESGARIVMSCGFDSIPSDLGVFMLQSLAREHLGGPLERVKGRVLDLKGGMSGGTVASMMATMNAGAADPEIARLMVDPFALTPGFKGPRQPPGNASSYDEDLDSWAGPFVMAIINTKVVHRTNALLGHPYGAGFVYDEMVSTGPGDQGEQAAGRLGMSLGGSGTLPGPGEGPTRDQREAGHFRIQFSGSRDGRTASVTVAGDMDPGYGSTSGMISESALCLLMDDVQADGGMSTPAAAMGSKLIDRLRAAEVLTFSQKIG